MTSASAEDEALTHACVAAAASIGKRRRYPENQLEEEICRHLPSGTGAYGARKEPVREEWTPMPGAIDLYGYAGDLRTVRWAAELKVDHVEWTLWDLFK